MAENPFAAPAEIRPAPGGLISVEQQRAVAEVQARMLIARANPRDPMRAVDQILQDCTRVSLAESALYQYARGGTDISGPSIKLMESIARRWGNIASGIKEVERRDGYSECIAYSWDLETGYYDERQFHVRHWRDTKQGGYRVTDERDIYEMIANMGQRRKRAVLEAVIPGDVVEAAVTQCEETLHTKADTSPEAIRKMVDAFAEFGVTKEQIETRCQRRLEAIRPAQIVMLRRIYSSLKDEMSTPGDWFEPVAGSPPATTLRGNEALRSRLTPQPPSDSSHAASPENDPIPPAPDDPAQPSAADDSVAATTVAEVTLARRGRPRSRRPEEEPTEEVAQLAERGSPDSVWVQFDPAGSVQEWFARARTRLREMEQARLTPDRFVAYRKANAGALMRLNQEFFTYWQQLDEIITAGERGQAVLGHRRPEPSDRS